ncbi:MAG: CCA tRNA nucleotidyltransferase [Cyanobacteria bacterium J06600_6]
MSAFKIQSFLAQSDFPCDLAQLPDDAHLVGGSVRDALLGRHKIPLDLDFVLPEKAIATAKYFANTYGGGFVILDADREIARVVFEQGTLDLARQEGVDLETDLHRRDFTINAIAYNLRSQQLVDPLNGLQDIEQGVLRMVAPENLEDDPLRLLRAYRQAAQLDFTIETATQTAIRERANLLQNVAAERVQAELNYVLTAPKGNQWLMAAIEDNLLSYYLPCSHRIDLQKLTAIAEGIEFCSLNGINDLCELPQSEIIILTKLSALVSIQPDLAEVELTNLKYARTQIRAVTKAVKHLSTLQQMIQPMNLREQYFWFLEVQDILPIIIARAIALELPREMIEPLIERYLDPQDPVAYPQNLVTGNDLIEQLNLKPSRVIGELLTAVQVAQIESKVATFEQAIDFARDWLKSGA